MQEQGIFDAVSMQFCAGSEVGYCRGTDGFPVGDFAVGVVLVPDVKVQMAMRRGVAQDAPRKGARGRRLQPEPYHDPEPPGGALSPHFRRLHAGMLAHGLPVRNTQRCRPQSMIAMPVCRG